MTKSTSNSNSNHEKEIQKDQTARLEESTISYLRGEIDLKTYRQRLREINSRFDLRKVASRLTGVQSD